MSFQNVLEEKVYQTPQKLPQVFLYAALIHTASKHVSQIEEDASMVTL